MTTQRQAIVIVPAAPDVVYVPAYNPSVVYGSWPYPNYPPYYYPPSPGYPIATGLAAGLAFGTGVAITRGLWGWGSPNWNTGSINVNVNRFNQINVNRTAISANTWQHNAVHRQGVPYGDAATRQRFGQQHADAAARRDYRGFQPAAAGGSAAAQPGAGAIANRPGGGAIATRPGGGAIATRPGGGAIATRPGGGAIASHAPTTVARPGSSAIAHRPSGGGAIASQAPAAAARPMPAARPAAFNPGNGAQARAAQARGNASRQQMGSFAGGRAAGGGFQGGGRARGGGGGGFHGGGGQHR